MASSEIWRCSHDYMANGAEGYGDFRSEHLAQQQQQQSHVQAPARKLQQSQIVFGDDSTINR